MTELSLEEELQSFAIGDLPVSNSENRVAFSLKDIIPAYGAFNAAKRLGVFGSKTSEIPGSGINEGAKVLIPVYTYQVFILYVAPLLYVAEHFFHK